MNRFEMEFQLAASKVKITLVSRISYLDVTRSFFLKTIINFLIQQTKRKIMQANHFAVGLAEGLRYSFSMVIMIL